MTDTIKPGRFATLPARIREIAALVVFLAASYAAMRFLPTLDPKAGIDVAGSLGAMPPIAAAAAVAWILTAIVNNTTFRRLTDADEKRLIERAEAGIWPALGPIAMDRLSHITVFWLIFTALIGG